MNAGDVHVWRVYLNQGTSYVNTLFGELSPDEQQKAGNYRFCNDRNRFVASRSMLRKILGGYLKCNSGQILFSYNRYGKPFLKGNTLRFNVSHSRGIALFAVAHGRDVGIDVEFVDPCVETMKTAQIAFSQAEFIRLQTLEPDLRATEFFRNWTRNEAILKAVGTGFSYVEKPEKNRDWTLIDLPVDQDYKAAMAIQGEAGSIRYHQIGTE